MPATHPSAPTGEARPVLLFQGDSITDAGRRRGGAPNHPHSLGSGYAALAASALLSNEPARRWQCYNRGVGGDTVADLAARWEADTLALAPDVLSLLIGINDLWTADADGASPDRYEARLRTLLDRTRSALPDVTLVIGEPFVVPGGSAVDASWPSALEPYRAGARRVAAIHDAVWIPYQSVIDAALEEAPGPYWAEDGIHPTPAGHYRMAQAWLEAVRARH